MEVGAVEKGLLDEVDGAIFAKGGVIAEELVRVDEGDFGRHGASWRGRGELQLGVVILRGGGENGRCQTVVGLVTTWLAMSEKISKEARDRYWRSNLKWLGGLLVVWFLVSYGCGILWVDALDKIQIPGTGFKLGFWFAQQGSIVVFVILIAIYVRVMNRLDKELLGDGGEAGSDVSDH